MPPTPAQARCLKCNYPLHSLPTNTCPECGQQFNPANPATMNLGKTPGPLAKKLLTHTGLPTFLLALAATLTLFIISGPPRRVAPKTTDTLYTLARNWSSRSTVEKSYSAALILWLALLLFYFLRIIARLITQRRYQHRLPSPARPNLRRLFFTFALVFSIATVLYAWPLRVARAWIASTNSQNSTGPGWSSYPPLSVPTACPLNLRPEDQLTALKYAIASLSSVKDRNAALNLYITHFPDAAPADLAAIASKPGDAEFRATAVHLLALYHHPDSAAIFQSLLNDADPSVSSAAADAIDILRGPGILNPYSSAWSGPGFELNTTPPIDVLHLLRPKTQDASYHWHDTPLPAVSFNPSVRATLEQKMTASAFPEERQAAARALVNWPPPNYQLRAAEWGVWIADPRGDLKLVQSVLDEIPPFVHRIGNTYKSLNDRYMIWYGPVTKPIIHFTADRPMALDVQVMINRGRPWFAYPKPDDLALSRINTGWGTSRQDEMNKIEKMDNKSFSVIADLKEGYPWLLPHHRLHLSDSSSGWFQGPSLVNATTLGLHWQSLIVLPTQANWMKPPAVPTDPKFKWWTDLRNVPCSYLASRGESERFLYYDGPTLAKPPRIAKLKNNQLTFELPADNPRDPTPDLDRALNERPPLKQQATPPRDHREAFFIRVTNGHPSALRLTVLNQPTTLPAQLPIDQNQAIPAFKKLLTDYGLTPEESQGLIDAWQTQFFHTDGQRLLLRLSAADYDALCPLSIKPPPTTLVRLGFVLTEFEPGRP